MEKGKTNINLYLNAMQFRVIFPFFHFKQSSVTHVINVKWLRMHFVDIFVWIKPRPQCLLFKWKIMFFHALLFRNEKSFRLISIWNFVWGGILVYDHLLTSNRMEMPTKMKRVCYLCLNRWSFTHIKTDQ